MSVPKLNSQFSDSSCESSGDGFQFRSHFPPLNQELEATSLGFECQPSKKPRFPKYVSNSMIPIDRNETMAMRNSFKTQLCRKFERGSCNYGERCRFVHGVKSISMPVNLEHKLCKMFTKQSECIYGDNCRFLHVYSENARESSASVVRFSTMKFEESNTSGSPQLESNRSVYGNFDANLESSRPVGLKTSQCSAWVRNGNDYGKTCHFVRARAEVQNLIYRNAPDSSKISNVAGNASTTSRTGPKVENLKWVFKWNDIEKISRIYADWIDTTTA